MADPLTLPGDIPGLLRRGSPVVYAGASTGWVYVGARAMAAGDSLIADANVVVPTRLRVIALDLSDPTGLAHAVWWMLAAAESGDRFPDGAIKAMEEAKASEMAAIALNRPAPQSMVRALRLAILAIAGRDES